MSDQREVHIHVDYCSPCGYKAHFDEMVKAIQERVPNAQVSGSEDARSGAFEVSINGQTVHSRLQTFTLPDTGSAVEAVQSVAAGGSVPSKLGRPLAMHCTVL